MVATSIDLLGRLAGPPLRRDIGLGWQPILRRSRVLDVRGRGMPRFEEWESFDIMVRAGAAADRAVIAELWSSALRGCVILASVSPHQKHTSGGGSCADCGLRRRAWRQRR